MVPPLGSPNRLKHCQGPLWTVVTHVNGAYTEKLDGNFSLQPSSFMVLEFGDISPTMFCQFSHFNCGIHGHSYSQLFCTVSKCVFHYVS